MRRFNSILAVLAAGFLMSTAQAGAGENLSIDLSGTWRINDDLSDDPREVLQKKMEEMGGGRSDGSRGGRGGGGGHKGGGGYGGNGGVNHEQMQERFRQLEQARRSMVILQEGGEVTMIYASGDTMTIVPDGKQHKRDTLLGEAETKAKWKDFALEVTTKGPQGAEMTRLYRISNEGRLEVVVFVQLPRDNERVEIVTVYDEVKKE